MSGLPDRVKTDLADHPPHPWRKLRALWVSWWVAHFLSSERACAKPVSKALCGFSLAPPWYDSKGAVWIRKCFNTHFWVSLEKRSDKSSLHCSCLMFMKNLSGDRSWATAVPRSLSHVYLSTFSPSSQSSCSRSSLFLCCFPSTI